MGRSYNILPVTGGGVSDFGAAPMAVSYKESSARGGIYMDTVAPRPDITDRKVIVNALFSLLVQDVDKVLETIKQKTVSLTGYVIDSGISASEYGKNGTISVRLPSAKSDEFSTFLRTQAVKVVSENVNASDITDQYSDYEEKITIAESQKAKFQEIMRSARTVEELLQVQNAIFQVQDQIDTFKGQIAYMKGASDTIKFTIALSTDEQALPYTPDKPWRPEVIFKQAVRSMIGTAEKLAGLAIFAIVYSPLVILVILVIKLIKKVVRRFKKKVE
jgi:hypothetical protein